LPTHLQPGDVIDGFRLEERLHQGGMAVIWRVTHPTQDPLPMIMKLPLIAYGEGPGAIVGFEVEQMILPRLKGPHVPRYIAQGGFDVQPYLVMKRLDPPSLLPLIDEAPLAAERVAEISAKVATALPWCARGRPGKRRGMRTAGPNAPRLRAQPRRGSLP
jgi:hypothetical protein